MGVAQRLRKMHVYPRDGSAHTVVRTATLREKLQIELSTSIHVTWFALHFHCAPLAQCIRLRRWFSCPSFPLVDDPPTKAEEHPLP